MHEINTQCTTQSLTWPELECKHLVLVTNATFVTNALIKKTARNWIVLPTTAPTLACTPLLAVGMLLAAIEGGGQPEEAEL